MEHEKPPTSSPSNETNPLSSSSEQDAHLEAQMGADVETQESTDNEVPLTESPATPETTANPDEPTFPITHRVQFNGLAQEFFGIWFVNNMLSVLTLGIYSAWAKVRTMQYFYGYTEVAGGSFQFTAKPLVILRGRIIAFALLVLYVATQNIQTDTAKIVLAGLLICYFAFAPVLIVLMMSFKLRYSQWRGVSFRFNRDFYGAYRVYLQPVFLLVLLIGSLILVGNEINALEPQQEQSSQQSVQESSQQAEIVQELEPLVNSDGELSNDAYSVDDEVVEPEVIEPEVDENAEVDIDWLVDASFEELGLLPYLFALSFILGFAFIALVPYFDFINTRFLSRNARLGQAQFYFNASVKDYYRMYVKLLLFPVVLIVLWTILGVVISTTNGVIFATFYALLVLITALAVPICRAYLKSQRYNLLMNNTSITEDHQLGANTTLWGMLYLMVTNALGVVFTLGLLTPWAQVRTARYLLNHTYVESFGSVDAFVAAQNDESTPLAEEVADMFDLDLVG